MSDEHNGRAHLLVGARRARLFRPWTRLSIPRRSTLGAGHNYIGTEHILLGLLREGEGVAARVLETLGADPAKIRTQVGRPPCGPGASLKAWLWVGSRRPGRRTFPGAGRRPGQDRHPSGCAARLRGLELGSPEGLA